MQVYDLIRTSSDSNATLDGPAPFSQDVYVITAEIAHQVVYSLRSTRDIPCTGYIFMITVPSARRHEGLSADVLPGVTPN